MVVKGLNQTSENARYIKKTKEEEKKKKGKKGCNKTSFVKLLFLCFAFASDRLYFFLFVEIRA